MADIEGLGEATMCKKFENDEEGYHDWIKDNQAGYIINSDKCGTDPQYPKLHRATCKHLSNSKNYTTNDYYKICSASKQELEACIRNTDGRPLSYCSQCKP